MQLLLPTKQRVEQFLWLVRCVAVAVFIPLSLALPVGSNAQEFETKAKYAYLVDYNTGTVLLSKNQDESMSPSSMTKTMTAYLIFDALKQGNLTLETKLPVSVKAWRMGGSKMFVKEGDDVTVADLLMGIVVQSGNDACIVAAEGISGSEKGFADDMNFMAKKLGMTGSQFRNSSGWPDPDHYVTAKDIVTLALRLYKDFPEYWHYFAETEFTYNDIKQTNRNGLLYRNIGADGLKTGYTSVAGYGLVSSAEQDGRRLFLVVNGLKSAKARITESERLLRHGFRDFKEISLYKAGDKVDEASVWMGSGESVSLVSSEDVTLLANKRLSRRGDNDVVLTVEYKGPIPAPITKGDKLATLRVTRNGTLEQEIALLAGEDVAPLSSWQRMMFNLTH